MGLWGDVITLGLGARMLSMVKSEALAPPDGVDCDAAPRGLHTGLKPSPRNMLPKNWCGTKVAGDLEVVWAAVSTILHTMGK